MGSGLLDVEARVEAAALESLRAWTDLTAIVGARISAGFDESADAEYPSAYVEAYNMAEFGEFTGWYMGGLRLGACSFRFDDRTQATVKKIHGALRMWGQQETLKEILNATAAAQSAAGLLTVGHIAMGEAYFEQASTNIWEKLLELPILVRPSR